MVPLVSFQATDAKPELLLVRLKGAGEEGAAEAGVGVGRAAKLDPAVGDAVLLLLRTYTPTGTPTTSATTMKVTATKGQKALAGSPHIFLVRWLYSTAASLSGSRLVKLLAAERADEGDATDR